MKKHRGNKIWCWLSSISFISTAVFIGLGFDKMLVYANGEDYPHKYRNVYVGGDAYNYIINGNYATAFFLLATMCALLGVAFIGLYYLTKIDISFTHYVQGNRLLEQEDEECRKKVDMEHRVYWDNHSAEKSALLEKRAQVEQKLNEPGIAIKQRKALQHIIQTIDKKLNSAGED